MKKNLVITTALGLLMLSGGVSAEIIASGTNDCGKNCSWSLDDAGNLTITGEGAMQNFSDGQVPWQDKMADIKNVSIDDNITSVGRYAFKGATNLESVHIPTSATSIAYGSFDGVSSLKNIDIPKSVTSIGGFAFSGTTNLENINFDDNSQLKTIGSYAFLSSGVLTFDLPNSVTLIGGGAFSGTKKLNTVFIDDNSQLKTIESSAFFNSAIQNIALPDGLESIGFRAFQGSRVIGDMYIPDTVTSIGSGTFFEPNITGVIFSENSQLESLDGSAFHSAAALETIILPPNLQFEEGTELNLKYTGKLQSLYLTPEQAENVSITGKSSTFAPKVYQIGTDGVIVSQNGREIYKYGFFGDIAKGEWKERYEYSDDRKYGGLRQETFAKDGDGEKYIGAKIFRPDGSIVLVDENNKFINKLHAKIYTVEEAMAVTRDGNVNRVRLTYK